MELADKASAGRLREVREEVATLDDRVLAATVREALARGTHGSGEALFRSLPRDRAVAVFDLLDPGWRSALLEGLRDDGVVGELLENLDPDDRAELLDELPANVTSRLLSGLSADERRMTAELLGYPARSVGRRMTPEIVTVPDGLTVAEALERVRERSPAAETIYMVPVTGTGRTLTGVVSLRRLLSADPITPVTAIASDPIAVAAQDPEEDAARLVRAVGAIAVPVIDAENRVVGVFTVDDAMRVLERAETEDQSRGGGVEPLGRPYLSAGILRIVRSRIVWLAGLVVGATLTVSVLDRFEGALEQVVTLALFVPLLIGTGGNAGSQAATTVVRAITTDDLTLRDLRRVVGREIAIGAALGSGLALAGFLPAWWFAGVEIAGVLALTVIAVCTLATMTGATVPLLARAAGVDPAVVSAPFITTFVDATGLIIYFTTATLLLDL